MSLYSDLERICPGRVLEGALLSEYTSFKIGGPADCVVICEGEDEITKALAVCRQSKTAFYILGNGSNILASDRGFRGVVLVFREKAAGSRVISPVPQSEQVRVRADAGCLLVKLAREAAANGLTGLEFASGIPGTVGGAVFMNAGAYGSEIADVIESARVIDENGNIITLSKDELKLGYRRSIVAKKGYIVLSADFLLKKGDRTAIEALMADLNGRRREKQPLEYPSAGSTFKRPEGYFAGKLIEDSGLRGTHVGDAYVSEKHCGFVVNKGKATAADVKALIDLVSDKVFADTGVRLEPEVRFLGEWNG